MEGFPSVSDTSQTLTSDDREQIKNIESTLVSPPDSELNCPAPEYQVPSVEKQTAPTLLLKFTVIFFWKLTQF